MEVIGKKVFVVVELKPIVVTTLARSTPAKPCDCAAE